MRDLRAIRGYSQERLAELLGVDRKVVNRLETGRRPLGLDRALDVSEALGVPLYWLFMDSWRPLVEMGRGGGSRGGGSADADL